MPPTDETPAIEVTDLRKEYGDVVANDGLSFAVRRGEIFGYLGPNGAGKSTTIRMLMGFQSPTAGTARVLGCDVEDDRAYRETRRSVGYLPATPAFDEDATGAEYLDFLGSLKGDSRREELLEVFDPPVSRTIRGYSSGNRQMLGIVQAFMHDPDVVVMDEPTAGLDPLKQERFHEFLRAERDAGTTLFFSSHVLSEVRRVCDRVGIIRQGRLVALETVASLLERGGKRVTLHTEESLSEADLALEGVVDLTLLGDGARFVYTGDYDALVDHLTRFSIVDVEIEEPPLEEVFMHFYETGPAGSGRSPPGEEGDAGVPGDGSDTELPGEPAARDDEARSTDEGGRR